MSVRDTERFLFRPWEAGDAARVVELFSDPGITAFPWGRPLLPSESLEMLGRWVAHWERQGFGLWAVVERASGSVAGTVGLSLPFFLPEVLPAPEVGWRLHSDWWGKGIAAEAAAAALDWGFDDLGFDRVVSIPQAANTRSWRLCERLGMRVERRAMEPKRDLALVVYEITAEEWRGGRGGRGRS